MKFRQQAAGMLQGGDLNGDGAIDAGEMQALAAKMGDRAESARRRRRSQRATGHAAEQRRGQR